MLTYRINTGSGMSDYTEFKPLSVSFVDNSYDDRYVAKILHSNSVSVNVGEIVTVSHNSFNDNENVKGSVYSNLLVEYEVIGVNDAENAFYVSVPKQYPLYCESIVLDYSKEERPFVIKFKKQHYFSYDEICNVMFLFNDLNGFSRKVTLPCEFIDNYTVSWVYDQSVENSRFFADYIYRNGYYYLSDTEPSGIVQVLNEAPDNVTYTSPEYIKLSAGVGSYFTYRKAYGVAYIPTEPFYRDNFFFTDKDDVTVRIKSATTQIQIPLCQNFAVDLETDDIVRESMMTDEYSYFYNDGVGVEKDIYRPCVFHNNNLEDVRRIKFNLHFRKRDNITDWRIIDSGFWNGTNDNDTQHPSLSGNYTFGELYDFTDNRSDLLSKLGFTDADVRYQKSKLKKTFLRISYYDSPNPVTQKLIAYYTVFLDTGNLLSKYIKYSNEKNYYIPGGDNDPTITLNPSALDFGISVSKEPYHIGGLSDDDIEEKRLSSQFVVSDRNLSTGSSDGFYLHLYTSYSSPIPSRVYMKVEFNHAKYGRKVPMFMPSKIYERDLSYGLKSYGEILDEWNTPAEGYGFSSYNAYSYIVMAHKYDYERRKHIFYPDNTYYGDNWTNFDVSTGTITYNLYEPKVRI